MIILKLVLRGLISAILRGLISAILIVLSTVNLQFQGWFVPISLRPLGTLCHGYYLPIKQLTSSTRWGSQYLQDSSQDMPQNIIYSP